MTEFTRISKRIASIAESATLKVDAKAKALQAAGRPVISYAAGEPDFATPQHIVEAASRAVLDPKNHRYTPAIGLPDLREAIAQKTLTDSGTQITAAQVVVTNGGKQAVYQAFATLLDPGDEVLMPTPFWTTYPEAIRLAGGVPVEVFAGADQGYRVTVERRKNKYDRMVSLSEAVVVVKIGDKKMLSVSESMDETGSDRGPVNALAKALAKDLGPYQSLIDDIRLVDFKVRITQGGTEAVTRVIIDSEDGQGRRWSTVGVSANIVDASFEALLDAILWKLVRDAGTAATGADPSE